MMSPSDEAEPEPERHQGDKGGQASGSHEKVMAGSTVAAGQAQPNGDAVTGSVTQPIHCNYAPPAQGPSVGGTNAPEHNPAVNVLAAAMAKTNMGKVVDTERPVIKQIPIGEPGIRSKLRFDVVTARVVEIAGKKHVSYSVTVKRVNDSHSVTIERRYNDFCYVYECILRNFHPSILGDYLFPKKVLIGNFKAEVITERTEAFHKLLNLIANCDNLLYSDYFYAFLSSEEHNEAVSHMKLARFEEAVPLLETVFFVREKLLSISNIHVLQCLCELVAAHNALGVNPEITYSYVLIAARSFDLVKNHQDAEVLRVPFLKLASKLAGQLGQEKREGTLIVE